MTFQLDHGFFYEVLGIKHVVLQECKSLGSSEGWGEGGGLHYAVYKYLQYEF